jgi:hypothetical protein
MSFEKYLQRSAQTVGSLSRELEKMNKKGESYTDDRFWVPGKDKTGNGFAVIRFLPAGGDEEIPWARVFSHGFQGPKGDWFIENCPTTLNGQKCPVCEANSVLWNSGLDSDKEIARARKRKLSYISNIYVINDPANKENEGKVFLYRYGKKIFDKITECMTPAYAGEEPIDPFNPLTGKVFKLKIKQIGDYPNYDSSEFGQAGPLFADRAKIAEVFDKLYPLGEFTDPTKFKSYDELSARLTTVLGSGSSAPRTTAAESSTTKQNQAPFAATSTPTPSATAKADDDDMSEYLRRLASEE